MGSPDPASSTLVASLEGWHDRSKSFTSKNVVNLSKTIIIIPILQLKNGGTERLSDVPEVTQLISGATL